ncbi:MAG TPA: Rne/Rng family ribonuclease [Gudongella oleilytica]|nr:Rne/Rng family ribonuclease [Gudongella oleilytica]
MNVIYIDTTDGSLRICIVEDGRLVEYFKDDMQSQGILGNVYRGRVENVLQGMEAAFVDIGIGKNAYLHIKDALEKDHLDLKDKPSIDDIITRGEDIIVQVIKEPLGNKGPKVTRHISIPGRYMVLTPFSSRVNISNKIKDISESSRLKELGKMIMKDEMGMIFRTVSENTEAELLKGEYEQLYKLYKIIEQEKNYLPTPKLIYSELDLLSQIIRDYYKYPNTEIVVNDRSIQNKLYNNKDLSQYDMEGKIIFDPDFNMDYNMNIQIDMKEALARRVQLKSGGFIVIDETEALTAIDVNTGKYVGNFTLEDTVLRTNIEAAAEIARQLRLRDIGGIIIVDFIDMKSHSDMEIVVEKLISSFKGDRNKPIVVDVTKLGLVEVVRKKNRPTLDNKVSITCPTCGGKGKIRKNEA